MRKSKQSITKLRKTKLSALSSQNVGKYEFLTSEDVLPEKGLSEKDATIKKFEYSPSGSEMKKQTGITKDQYKIFKDQINVLIALQKMMSRQKMVSKQNDKIIDDVHNKCTGVECKDLIDNIFTFGLMKGNLHLTNFDNQ